MHKTIGFLLLLASAAGAQGHYQNFCTSGATKASVQGIASVNFLQSITPSCTVAVYATGTATLLAPLYQDTLNTPLGNPFIATNSGYYSFYGSGAVDVVMTGAGMTTTTLSNVNLTPGAGTVTGVTATGSGGIAATVTAGAVPAILIGPDVLHVLPLLTDTQYWNGLVASVTGSTGFGFITTSTGGNNPQIGTKTDGTHTIPLNSDVANWNAKCSTAGCVMTGTLRINGIGNQSLYIQGSQAGITRNGSPANITWDIDRATVNGADVEMTYEFSGISGRQYAGPFLAIAQPGAYRIEDRIAGDQHHGVTFESGNAHAEGVLTVYTPGQATPGGGVSSTSPCPVWNPGGSPYALGGLTADDNYLYHCNSNGIGWKRIAWTAIP